MHARPQWVATNIGAGRGREEDATRSLVVVPHAEAQAETEGRLGAGDQRRLAALDGSPRTAFLAGRQALLQAAALLAPGARVVIEAECPDCGGSHGRPVAVGAASPIHLALSHAGDRAFAVASRRPVGIDAEPLATPSGRREAVDDLLPGRRSPLHRWTAAEAVVKADGRGLRVDPAAVRLRLVPGRSSATLDGARYRLRTRLVAGCRVTVATRCGPQRGGSLV